MTVSHRAVHVDLRNNVQIHALLCLDPRLIGFVKFCCIEMNCFLLLGIVGVSLGVNGAKTRTHVISLLRPHLHGTGTTLDL